jgi:urease gamma subunit
MGTAGNPYTEREGSGMIGRRMVAAGVVAGAVAVGGVAGAMVGIPGLSGAATTGSTGSSSSTTAPAGDGYGGPHFRGVGPHVRDDGVFAAAAKALNLSTEDLMQKLSDGTTTIADVAGQQDVDVQTVIDAMEGVAKQNIEDLVNNPLPARPDFPDGPKMGPGFGFGRHGSLDSVAEALGITTDELRADLRNGQSVADIAKAKKVDLDTIVDALVRDATEKLDQAVQDERLTQDQADKITADLKARITDFVNGDRPDGPGRLGGFGRRHGGPGFFGPGRLGPGRFGPGRFGPGGAGPGSPEEASPTAAAA